MQQCKLCGKSFVCDNGMWFTTCTCAKDRPEELAMAQSVNQFSTKHPHEPEVEPIFDKEGRCLICCMIVRDRKIANYKEELEELEAKNKKLLEAIKTYFEALDKWPYASESPDLDYAAGALRSVFDEVSKENQ